MSEENKRRYYQQLLQAAENSAGLVGAAYRNAVEQSYLNPEAASLKMDKLYRRKGVEAVHKMLQENPGYFGRPPGSLLSTDALRPGARQRLNDAMVERQKLAGLFTNYRKVREEARTARRALDEMAPPAPNVPNTSENPNLARDNERSIAVDGRSLPDAGRQEPQREPYRNVQTPHRANNDGGRHRRR